MLLLLLLLCRSGRCKRAIVRKIDAEPSPTRSTGLLLLLLIEHRVLLVHHLLLVSKLRCCQTVLRHRRRVDGHLLIGVGPPTV